MNAEGEGPRAEGGGEAVHRQSGLSHRPQKRRALRIGFGQRAVRAWGQDPQADQLIDLGRADARPLGDLGRRHGHARGRVVVFHGDKVRGRADAC